MIGNIKVKITNLIVKLVFPAWKNPDHTVWQMHCWPRWLQNYTNTPNRRVDII